MSHCSSWGAQMELTVAFECPECRRSYEFPVAELSLGKERRCTECNLPTVLTDQGIHGLRLRLREIYPVSLPDEPPGALGSR